MEQIKNSLIFSISREDNLDLIQKYVQEKDCLDATIKKDVSSEMFRLFFSIIELGRDVRLSLKDGDFQNTKLKIADIFLELISVCNYLNINLYDTLTYKEKVLNEKIAKWF